MDYSKLCRSCMAELAKNDLKTFDQDSVDMFVFCTNIQISENDEFPKHFCQECIYQINNCYKYIKNAQEVNEKLKNLLGKRDFSFYEDFENNDLLFNIDTKVDLIDNNTACISDEDDKTESRPVDDDDNLKLLITKTRKRGKRKLPEKPCNMQRKTVETKMDQTLKSQENCAQINTTDMKNINFSEKTGEIEDEITFDYLAFNIVTLQTKNSSKDKHDTKRGRPGKLPEKPCNMLRLHRKTKEDKKYMCTACGKSFKLRKGLVVHALTHSNDRPFVCDICQMTFKMKQVLVKHMKTHETERTYLCHICAKAFKINKNLQDHMSTHTSERSFACSSCSFRARFKSSLHRHTRRRHQRLNATHQCDHCLKAFHDPDSLKRHIRIHTGERPYKCPSCPLSFIDHWKRKIHLMNRHQMAFDEIPRLNRDGQPTSW